MKYALIKKIIWKVFENKGKRALKKIESNTKNAMAANTKRLMEILKRNKNTEFGKKYHFADIKTLEDYRRIVPLSNYEVYLPYIEKMVKGEKNLITTYPIVTYAETSGSSTGIQKTIPVTKNSMRLYSSYSMARAFALMKEYYRKQGKKIPNGSLFNTLEISRYYMPDGTPREWISSATLRLYAKFLRFMVTSPKPILFPEGEIDMRYFKSRFALEDPNIVVMVSVFMSNLTDIMDYIKDNWKMLVDDIEKGVVGEDKCDKDARKRIMPFIHKNPERANELRKIFAEGFDEPIALKIWPKLSSLTTVGTAGFASQTKKMREYVGDLPMDFSLLAPSEGMVAACLYINDDKFIPLVESCFYEFIPVECEDNCIETLTLNELEVGKEYEVVLTTEGGLYRYKLKDVVRVLGCKNSCPIIKFVYRKNMLASIAGEKTSVEQLDYAVKKLAQYFNCDITDYSIYLDTQFLLAAIKS